MRYVLVVLMLLAVMFGEEKKKVAPKLKPHPVTYLEALDNLPKSAGKPDLSNLYKLSGLKPPKAKVNYFKEYEAIPACEEALAKQKAEDSDFTLAVAEKFESQGNAEYNKLVAQYNELLQRYKDVVAR